MVAYIAIIVKVSKSQRRVKAHGESEVTSNSIKRESALARRVFAIILTDLSCWIPVIVLSILALTGNFYDEQGEVYVWFAVFVLPVNSSVNPVLYTFSTPKVRILAEETAFTSLCCTEAFFFSFRAGKICNKYAIKEKSNQNYAH